ncbi:MAG: TonB family protein [Kordiimonadaceae bacterium]|nr:TonB family protein [Kordiimonadaceae bacterium]
MFKYLIIFIIFAASTALADEAADKAEFQKLYAEFNDLYANSEDLDPIIEVGEKLYQLAPKIYGKNSQNMAIVTYNLASLYDEKGGETNSDDEKKAFDLYKEYFEILETNEAPKDRNYIEQFFQYLTAYYNVNGRKSKSDLSDLLLKYANDIDYSPAELASLNYNIANLHIKQGDLEGAEEPLSNAHRIYSDNPNTDQHKIAEIEYLLSVILMDKESLDDAAAKLKTVIEIYETNSFETDIIIKKAYLNLGKILFGLNHEATSAQYIMKYIDLIVPEHAPLNEDNNGDEFLPSKRVNPKYPAEAADNGIEGFAVLLFDVNEKGNTQNVKAIASSSHFFEPVSIRAVQQYKYKPKLINDTPVPVKNLLVRLEYKLERR